MIIRNAKILSYGSPNRQNVFLFSSENDNSKSYCPSLYRHLDHHSKFTILRTISALNSWAVNGSPLKEVEDEMISSMCNLVLYL